MKNIILIVLVVFGIISCTNSNTEPQVLHGNFVEVTPENNRTTLIFSSNSNQLEEKRISDTENTASRTYSIRIVDDNLIELSSNEADEISPRILHYQIVNSNKFEIGSINQNDPENTIMIFERD